MDNKKESKMALRVIISGGGTGGHIFPALSIADGVKREYPNSQLLFVGAQGRMEMERVPAAGYEIVALPIMGLKRELSLSNLKIPFKLLKSIRMASKIITNFKPNLIVGVGGYASAPLLIAAALRGIPYLIQEQNSYAGLTNRLVGKRASKICVAYPNMERFFPKERIILTGNPVREEIRKATKEERERAKVAFGFTPKSPLILIVGGSLGARSLNEAFKKWLLQNRECDISFIWQYGSYYAKEIEIFNRENPRSFVKSSQFIKEMGDAFAAADLVISRAGAGTISELAIASKATIFVPSPNVSEDHQRHNAIALVSRGAAEMVEDSEVENQLFPKALSLIKEQKSRERLEREIGRFALHNSTELIVRELVKIYNREE